MRKTDPIDVLEAAYDLDTREEPWLGGIAEASRGILDDGSGVFAFTYDASVPARMSIGGFARTSNHVHFDATTALEGIMSAGGGEYVQNTFRRLQVEGTRSTPGFAGSDAEQAFDAMGVGDLLVVNGVDPSGLGICMGALVRQRVQLSRRRRERLARVATHLANSLRLRRRLDAHRRSRRAPWDADAVLTIRGRVEHAESPEAQLRESRSALRDAAAAVDRARGKLRRIDPDSALGQWMGLVDGRWSLVDKFDTDGKRYVLARRNEPRVGGLGLLTERERAVAFYAAMGRSNKHIAYDLGIAHSTVRVLLARAAAKLGVKTRDELVAIAQGAVAEGK
jgi:DNA-binding CsgD family transcriptional regulator